MLGAAPIAGVIEHSELFVAALTEVSGTVVDLGSGGGVPGLVIAWRRPDLDVVLVDRRATRTDHLRRLVTRLGLGGRVTVIDVRAAGTPPSARPPCRRRRRPWLRFTARRRSGGGTDPAIDGLLVVSEPPGDADRWADAGPDFVRRGGRGPIAVLVRVPRGSLHGEPTHHSGVAVSDRVPACVPRGSSMQSRDTSLIIDVCV